MWEAWGLTFTPQRSSHWVELVPVSLWTAWAAHSLSELSHSAVVVGRHNDCWNSWFHLLLYLSYRTMCCMQLLCAYARLLYSSDMQPLLGNCHPNQCMKLILAHLSSSNGLSLTDHLCVNFREWIIPAVPPPFLGGRSDTRMLLSLVRVAIVGIWGFSQSFNYSEALGVKQIILRIWHFERSISYSDVLNTKNRSDFVYLS